MIIRINAASLPMTVKMPAVSSMSFELSLIWLWKLVD